MEESGDGGNLTDEGFSSWRWARLHSYARARALLATGHSWEADGWDGWWLPEGVRGMDVGPTGVRLDVDGRRVEVVGRFQRTADGQRVVVPTNRGAKRRDDLELLDAVGELLPGLEAVIPPAGRPRGGIIERAVRKVEGLISEGKSQHAAIEHVRTEDLGWNPPKAASADSLLREVRRARAAERARDQ